MALRKLTPAIAIKVVVAGNSFLSVDSWCQRWKFQRRGRNETISKEELWVVCVEWCGEQTPTNEFLKCCLHGSMAEYYLISQILWTIFNCLWVCFTPPHSAQPVGCTPRGAGDPLMMTPAGWVPPLQQHFPPKFTLSTSARVWTGFAPLSPKNILF